jgi:hypothetical protein
MKRQITADTAFHPAERRRWTNQQLDARRAKISTYGQGAKERELIDAELSARKHSLKPRKKK